jgi:hypothetical protein
LIPRFDGAILSLEGAIWDRYVTGAPRRRRRPSSDTAIASFARDAEAGVGGSIPRRWRSGARGRRWRI